MFHTASLLLKHRVHESGERNHNNRPRGSGMAGRGGVTEISTAVADHSAYAGYGLRAAIADRLHLARANNGAFAVVCKYRKISSLGKCVIIFGHI